MIARPRISVNFKLMALLGTVLALALAALFFSSSREWRILATRINSDMDIGPAQVEELIQAYESGGWETLSQLLISEAFFGQNEDLLLESAQGEGLVSTLNDIEIRGIEQTSEGAQVNVRMPDSDEVVTIAVPENRQSSLNLNGEHIATVYLLSQSGSDPGALPSGEVSMRYRLNQPGSTDDALAASSVIKVAPVHLDGSAIDPNFAANSHVVRSINTRVMYYALAIGFLALGGGILIGFQITSPIKKMVTATEKIKHGKLGYTVDIKSRDELGTLAESFNAMSLKLAQNENLRKKLITDVAHELRTPVTGLRCQLEALQDGVATYSPEQLSTLLSDTVQLQRLIEDLSELIKAEDGRMPIHKETCRVEDIIAGAIRAAQPESQNVSVRQELESVIPPLYTDPARLQQVLVNVLSNAVRYAPRDSTIFITASLLDANPAQVEIEVQDQGPGIPESELENVFERLYRLDDARARDAEDHAGSGLGLAISREIMKLLGGNIVARSPGDSGTTMIITLDVSS